MSNEARLRILTLLHERPMNITEIARELKVSQPTVTSYVNQLEEAGLLFTRIQKGINGYGKICFLVHDALTVSFNNVDLGAPENEIVCDMPVGHYSAINLSRPGLLASQSRILASREDSSRFFHPDRMDADLLVIRGGTVQYLFPYNVPDDHRIVRLELSAEGCSTIAARQQTDVRLTINDLEFAACQLPPANIESPTRHMPAWYPHDLPPVGHMLVWKVDREQTLFNGSGCGRKTLADLQLKGMQPIKITLAVGSDGEPLGDEGSGLVLFGRNFGRFDQDLRLRVIHEQR